jgi:hypothetical protein
MTHATITPHTAVLCAVVFDYNESSKEAVKALQGASFDGHNWLVPILHLPVLKLIFGRLTVAPEVVTDYHALLKRMLTDFAGSGHRKGKLGEHITELQQRHAVGIAAVHKTGWKPAERPQRIQQPNDTTVTRPVDSMSVSVSPAEEKAIGLWLRGSKNAAANAEKKAHMVMAVKRKRKKAA